jgi:hypothetical protein
MGEIPWGFSLLYCNAGAVKMKYFTEENASAVQE